MTHSILTDQVLLVGLIVVTVFLLKAVLQRSGFPPMLGFLGVGFLLSVIDHRGDWLSPSTHGLLEFLAQMGVICLLFRVGLESDLSGMLRRLRPALVAWVATVSLSFLLGYLTCRDVFGFGLLPSLLTGTALTATSVGIPLSIWHRHRALTTPQGSLLVTIAELDDLSGVLFMALLFSVIDPLRHEPVGIAPVLGKTTGLTLLKLVAFGAGCFLFSRYLEKPLTSALRRLESAPDPMITLLAVGFIIAALAGYLGFSVAIGGFFAGLLFSRDPQAVRMEASFDSLYELFVPFFFVGIGLQLAPSALVGGLGLGLVLLVVAAGGKVVGALPLWPMVGGIPTGLIGVSLIPRAEIAMIIMQHGRSIGGDVVPESLYAGMVVLCLLSCTLAPLALQVLLRRYPPASQ